MPWEAERSTDFPLLLDVSQGQVLCSGFSDKLTICQGLEWGGGQTDRPGMGRHEWVVSEFILCLEYML